MKPALLAGFLVLSAGLFAQNTIPAGTILPVRLNSSLDSRRSKPGQIISATVMQNTPLAAGSSIRAGAKILGNIEIGIGSKVAAGSVVLRDVPPHTTVAGIPARVVGRCNVAEPALEMDSSFPFAADDGAGI